MFSFIAVISLIYSTPIILLWHQAAVMLIYTTASLPSQNLNQAVLVINHSSQLGFTLNEINHLQDVGRLIQFSRVVFTLSLLFLIYLYYFHHHRHTLSQLLKQIKSASIISFWGSILIIIVFSLFWEFAFVSFHQLFFPQGNWAFPADSLLITLFPEIFWQMVFTAYALLVILISFCFWLIIPKSRPLHTQSSL